MKKILLILFAMVLSVTAANAFINSCTISRYKSRNNPVHPAKSALRKPYPARSLI